MSSFDEYLIGLVGKWNGWGLVLFTVITTLIAAVLTGLIGFEREGRSSGWLAYTRSDWDRKCHG